MLSIDQVYGFSDKAPQQWMYPTLFLVLPMVALPLVVLIPTHIILKKVRRPANP